MAEFDRREGWRSWGCLSAAHWLNYRCALALGPAREKVPVARRLEELPVVAAAFSTGELSYSKVRAMTRVATHANEQALVDLGRAMTASHLERVVRSYRQIPDDDQAGGEGDDKETVARRRRLDYRWTADDMLEIRALLPAEEGALGLAALRRAADHLFRHRAHHAGEDDGRADDSCPDRPGPGVADADNVPSGNVRADRSGRRRGPLTERAARGADRGDDVPAGGIGHLVDPAAVRYISRLPPTCPMKRSNRSSSDSFRFV